MKKLNRAIAEYIQLKAEGYTPKLLWEPNIEQYFVSIIWSEKLTKNYIRLH